MTMPNIISDTDWPESILTMRSGFAGKLNVYRMMAHNPQLLAAWENLRNHVVIDSRLTPYQSEIVILRTGWWRRSRYEWQHHVSRGRKAGLSDAVIAACGRKVPDVSGEDRLLIDAVDALVTTSRLPEAIREALTDSLGMPATLDIMATIGLYTTLSFILETFAVPIDDDIATELAGDPLAQSPDQAWS